MLPKTSTYVETYDGQTKWIYFLLKIMTYWKNIILFGIKSALTLKKNCEPEIVSLCRVQIFLKTKIKSYGDKVTDFYDKEIPKVDSNYTGLAVMSLD